MAAQGNNPTRRNMLFGYPLDAPPAATHSIANTSSHGLNVSSALTLRRGDEQPMGNGRIVIDLNVPPPDDDYDIDNQIQSFNAFASQTICGCKRKQAEGTASDPISVEDDDEEQGNGQCHCGHPNGANPSRGITISGGGNPIQVVTNTNVAENRSVRQRISDENLIVAENQNANRPSWWMATSGNARGGSSSSTPPPPIMSVQNPLPTSDTDGSVLWAHIPQQNDLGASMIGGNPRLAASEQQARDLRGVVIQGNANAQAGFDLNSLPPAPASGGNSRIRNPRSPRPSWRDRIDMEEEFEIQQYTPNVLDSIEAIQRLAPPPSLVQGVGHHVIVYAEERGDIDPVNDDDQQDVPYVFHLDIDNMTYEELLALGELIGFVQTGLTAEEIQERMKRRYYRLAKNTPPEDVGRCCICLEKFVNRDVLGKLDCVHQFHYDCIEQWLLEKNKCPICRSTALAEPK